MSKRFTTGIPTDEPSWPPREHKEPPVGDPPRPPEERKEPPSTPQPLGEPPPRREPEDLPPDQQPPVGDPPPPSQPPAGDPPDSSEVVRFKEFLLSAPDLSALDLERAKDLLRDIKL